MARSILIVEDEPVLRNKLSQLFKSEGFCVFKACNGDEGLKLAFRTLPEIILSDIHMPQMDGLTMLRELRSYEWGKKIGIIILSNTKDQESMQIAKLHGVIGYYIKSQWDLKILVTRIKEKIGQIKRAGHHVSPL